MRPYIPIFQDKKAGEWSASQLCLADRSGYHWRNGRNYHRKRRAWERRRERRGQASRVHENHKLCPLRKWGAIRGCLLLNTWGQINIIYTYILDIRTVDHKQSRTHPSLWIISLGPFGSFRDLYVWIEPSYVYSNVVLFSASRFTWVW